nr:hypothetical protein [Tanacetum cinerariifolium]
MAHLQREGAAFPAGAAQHCYFLRGAGHRLRQHYVRAAAAADFHAVGFDCGAGVDGDHGAARVGAGLHQYHDAVFPLLPQPGDGAFGVFAAAAGGAAGHVWGGGHGAVAGQAACAALVRRP